jgi:hypothetical protein
VRCSWLSSAKSDGQSGLSQTIVKAITDIEITLTQPTRPTDGESAAFRRLGQRAPCRPEKHQVVSERSTRSSALFSGSYPITHSSDPWGSCGPQVRGRARRWGSKKAMTHRADRYQCGECHRYRGCGGWRKSSSDRSRWLDRDVTAAVDKGRRTDSSDEGRHPRKARPADFSDSPWARL